MNAERRAIAAEVTAFNRLLDGDPHLQSALVPIGAGLILAVFRGREPPFSLTIAIAIPARVPSPAPDARGSLATRDSGVRQLKTDALAVVVREPHGECIRLAEPAAEQTASGAT